MVKVLQVVGFKKSGKTTVTNIIIKHLKSKGFKVAVIKHHGDRSGQDIDIPKKRDHITYMDSGADESIVQGYQFIHKLVAKADTKDTTSLEYMIQNEVTTNPDIILVEGYKAANYDKIVLYQSNEDLMELKQLSFVKYALDTSVLRKEDIQGITSLNETLEQFLIKWVDDTRETI
ncbi:molybdopterin-guanine dinucleotide biosynthesis protein B [Macrococcus sp. DPC7161]|uniref:molybdopterin-guanine dinucleotide biosynthesis protein B n=1 Tax=Macrococcus sp. DPC7161 TaxID=2507060 RepID=UPI00100C33AB|nr:molybdopterin-guanine dinucleotide biosynthesis protein B [Macrococcus sp. DPC7161]RXK18598.1 molybdopterin-guanine dinucleotide biosynthesis protein B [Macrococcus sp. DPC7161]